MRTTRERTRQRVSSRSKKRRNNHRRVMVAPYEWTGGDQSKFIRVVREILAPKVSRAIVLHVPHGQGRLPIQDKRFHIWFWSSPLNKRDASTPATMWGIKVDMRDSSLRYSGTGLPIIDQEGVGVAEYLHNNLYIYHDLCHYGSQDELKILRRILQSALGLIDEVSKKRLPPEDVYAMILYEYRRASASSIGDDLKKYQALVRDKMDALTQAVRDERSCQDRLESVLRDRDACLVNIRDEYRRIKSNPYVTKCQLDFKEQVLIVYTKYLYVRAVRDGSIRALGHYRLVIPLHSSGKIKAYNLTRRVDYDHHPHGYEDGSLCLGNISNGIAKLMGEYQFDVVVHLLTQFLQVVNEDDGMGRTIYNWPKATAAQLKRDSASEQAKG